MFRKKLLLILSLLTIASVLLVACGGNGADVVDDSSSESQDTSTGETANTSTDEPEPEGGEEVAPTGDRKGGWLDTISMSVVSSDSAVTQIEAGAIDIYSGSLSTPQDLEAIAEAGLDRSDQFGLFYELTFNPVGPIFDGTGKLNPFSSTKIREAMNWLVDRDYINQEIYGGASLPKWFPITSGFPDYAKYVDVIRPLEAKYTYNLEQAQAVITEEMEAMGASLVDGVWNYADEPVELIFLIRTDGDGTRRPIGDYVANQLEEVGFMVDRQYKTSSEASPLWVLGDPNDGLWHLYTGAWSVASVDRDQGDDFQFYYTQQSAYAFSPLWQAYNVSDADLEVTEALANNTYSSVDERRELFTRAIELIFDYSYRIWLIDGKGFSTWRPDVTVSYDLAAGVDVNTLAPFTLRLKDEVGGLVRWGNADILVDPANPIAGSNWTFDSQWQNATSDWDAIPNPFTGVQLPQRLDHAEVIVEEGLPVTKTYDWVDLSFSEEIEIPDDVMVTWDVASQTFLTVADWKAASEIAVQVEDQAAALVGEVDFAALTSDAIVDLVNSLSAYYTEISGNDADATALLDAAIAIPEVVEEEDGEEVAEEPETRSNMQIKIDSILALGSAEEQSAALADYLVEFVISADSSYVLDLAGNDYTSTKTKTVYYYPAELWDITWHDGSPMSVADFMMSLIMTWEPGSEGSAVYDPSQSPVLESFLSTFKGFRLVSEDPLVMEFYSDTWYMDAEAIAVPFRTQFWPEYGYGQAGWHMIAVSNKAEAAGELAYSADKADSLEVEWMNFVAGPSLDILEAKLDEAIAESYIPYEPTLGAFITADDAAVRYQNLKDFYAEHGHFWVGTGPYILDEVFAVEKTLTLTHNPNYPDPADKWSLFSEPKLADVTIDGAGRAVIGEEAAFDVFVTYQGEDYPSEEIIEVKYLLFNADGDIVEVDQADLVEEGHYQITLSTDTTSQLASGANKLEVAVTVLPVSIPSFGVFEFVTE